MSLRQVILAASLLGGSVLASSSQASLVIYTDRVTWLAAIGGATGGENFNGFGVDTSFNGSSLGLASGMAIGTQVSSGDANYNLVDVLPHISFQSDIDGTPSALIFTGQSGSVTAPFISFSVAVSAFGADFRALNDGSSLLTRVEIRDGNTQLDVLEPPSNSGTQFWGFFGNAGETVTEIRFLRLDNDVFGIDNIEIRAADVAVPEPATLALFGFGVAILGAARRRRQA